MNFKVGDRVRFLNDVGGGVITRIDKKTVNVLGSDGFEVPMLKSEVIVIDQSTDNNIKQRMPEEQERPGVMQDKDRFAEEEIEFEGKEIINQTGDITDPSDYDFSKLDDEDDPDGDLLGLHVAFVPKNQGNIVDSDHELFIINDSPYRVFYSVSKWEEGLISTLKSGFMYPDTKDFVYEFKREELNEDNTLNIQSLFFKNISFVAQQPEFFDLKLNPTKFFKPGSFVDNDFFEEKALLYSIADSKKEELIKTLTSKNIDAVIKEKESPKKGVKKVEKIPEIEEVDLHIHELVDNPNDYTPGQIIEIQLARFKVALDGGINGRTKKMVFIHGVGNGKLKHEVRKELQKNYPKLKFQDASFKEYGYGATMVFIRR
ncbi:MAG: DUF2027 domain-containing protein [Perlabentimonas sp.]